MEQDVFVLNGLSKDILDKLSYKSNLGISLKRNLHYFNKEDVMKEMITLVGWLKNQSVLEDVPIDFRIKSMESISSKFDRYYPGHQLRKVFDDILGFRAFCDSYDDVLKLEFPNIRIVDMTKWKANDDGYRGVHVYYQRDTDYYPIEIQFNTLYDRQINNWLHDYVYKKNYPLSVGKELRRQYENGNIKNVEEFEEVLAKCVTF